MKKLLLIAVVAGMAAEARATDALLQISRHDDEVITGPITDLLVRDDAIVLRGVSWEGEEFSLEVFYSPDRQRFAAEAGFALELAIWKARNTTAETVVALDSDSLSCGPDASGDGAVCVANVAVPTSSFAIQTMIDGGFPGVTVMGTAPGVSFASTPVRSLLVSLVTFDRDPPPALMTQVRGVGPFDGTGFDMVHYWEERDLSATFRHFSQVLDTMADRGETMSIVTTSATPDYSGSTLYGLLSFVLGP